MRSFHQYRGLVKPLWSEWLNSGPRIRNSSFKCRLRNSCLLVLTIMQQTTETYYDMSTILGIENNNSESDEMEAVINQVYLQGEISRPLTM